MSKTLGGAEFDPDDGFTAEEILRQTFGGPENLAKLTSAARVMRAIPYLGEPAIDQTYGSIEPSPN